MVFWGGYSSYFSDADGHLWEVAWNPFTAVDEEGKLLIENARAHYELCETLDKVMLTSRVLSAQLL